MAQLDLAGICLFLDVDGTLVEFARCPEDVRIDTALVASLARLSEALHGAFALVSGRPIKSLDTLFRPLRFAAAGVHGAEMRMHPDAPIVRAQHSRLPERVRLAVHRVSSRFPGSSVEDKESALALHYRAAPEYGEALPPVVEALVEGLDDPTLVAIRGHEVIEIRRRDYEKGGAIERLMHRPEFVGRRPIFIGDDVTDLPGFLTALRHDGAAYSVGHRIPGLTGAFADPDEVRRWIEALVTNAEAAQ